MGAVESCRCCLAWNTILGDGDNSGIAQVSSGVRAVLGGSVPRGELSAGRPRGSKSDP